MFTLQKIDYTDVYTRGWISLHVTHDTQSWSLHQKIQSTLLNFFSNGSSSNSCLIEQCDSDLTQVTQGLRQRNGRNLIMRKVT